MEAAPRQGRMCLMVSICFLTAENFFTKFFKSLAEEATLGDWAIEKANLLCVLHLGKVKPQVAFLGH